MTLRAVFFDLDGTLLDTAGDLAHALNALLQAKGKSTLPFTTIRKVVSDGAAALIKLGFNIDEAHPDYPNLREDLLAFYNSNLSQHTQPFEGIATLIKILSEHDIAWGIVTNKPWAYTEPLMQKHLFASEPSAVICPDHVQHKKPHPEALLLACKQTQCTPEQAIYVGDHKRDIDCGRNAGCDTIAVGYGYIPENESHTDWQATHNIAHADEMWPIIKTYIRKNNGEAL